MPTQQTYQGYEVGPIRPPSEAHSLLLRLTRNCPWNRCKFCGIYRDTTFSVRSVEHLLRDIDRIKVFVDRIQEAGQNGEDGFRPFAALPDAQSPGDQMALRMALNWVRGGMRAVFLQDANSLVVKPADLVAILTYLRRTFPQIQRVTAYARSHSVARIADSDLQKIARAGLNRLHIGMESAADTVLELVDKGVDKETQIRAGRKVKQAGIELSEYFMPGLGGRELSTSNALDTAEAMNRIDPDFIRIRTLALPPMIDLYREAQAGRFTPLNDIEKARELLEFLEHLEGIRSIVKSDHILNLFQDVEGRLPDDKPRMTSPIRSFLELDSEQQLLYLVGRRCGIFSSLADLDDPELQRHAQQAQAAHKVTWDNLDAWVAAMVQRFI